MLPDWRLPAGIDRGVWDYIHSETLARGYDASLARSPVLRVDQPFVEKWFPNPGKIIDLGCGTGRLLLPLAQRGFTCVGVDLSTEMLRIVSEKTRAAGVTITCLLANIVELDAFVDASFDYAACMFSTFGMIRGSEARRKMLGHVWRILKPGGRFIVHVHHRWFRWGRGSGKAGPEPGDRTMPQHYAGAELTLHHFTRREIRHVLVDAGFAILEMLPVALSPDGRLRYPWWFGSVRTYGFLLACEKQG